MPLHRAESDVRKSKTLFVAACRNPDRTFSAVVFDDTGAPRREIPLQGRGHDAAHHPASGRITVFARRPGNFAVSFNALNDDKPVLFTTPEDRHFYGHGLYSANGHLLFSTENYFTTGAGVIGIYDATNGYTRVGEIPSHGVGPHDVAILSDQTTLVVANGGIKTHPDYGRLKLNIPTMAPSLCFIDSRNGTLIARQELPKDLHQLSIRHLAVDANDRVWFGGQWEGDTGDTPPLIGTADRETNISLIETASSLNKALKGYVGSICTTKDSNWIAASAPRANKVALFNAAFDQAPALLSLKDASGVAALNSPAGVAITNGLGEFHSVLPKQKKTLEPELQRAVGSFAFDNHLLSFEI